MVDAGEHLADRPVRCELKRERTDELGPRRACELDAVSDGASEAIQPGHRQHLIDVPKRIRARVRATPPGFRGEPVDLRISRLRD